MALPTAWIRQLSLKGKLRLIATASNAVAMLLAGTFLMMSIMSGFRTGMGSSLDVTTQIIATSVSSSLASKDDTAADRMLSGFAALAGMRGACLYDNSGGLFASYQQTPSLVCSPTIPRLTNGYAFS